MKVLKGNGDANKRHEVVINGGTSPYIMGAAEFNWGQAKYILSTQEECASSRQWNAYGSFHSYLAIYGGSILYRDNEVTSGEG